MDVIVLAGGYAKRLWPLTEKFPKTLLTVAGNPVLYYLLENISHIPQIDSVTVAIDESDENYFDEIIDKFNVFSTPRPQIAKHCTNTNGSLVGPLTKIHEIYNNKKKYRIKGKEYCIVGGDNLFGFPLAEFAHFFRLHHINCVAIHEMPYSVDASQFGIPELAKPGTLTNIVEKPHNAIVRMVSTACYSLTSDTMDYLDDYLNTNKTDNLGEFIGWLAHKTKINVYIFKQPWCDIGTREGLLAANCLMLSSANLESSLPTLLQKNVTIDQPVLFEDDVEVIGSWIGPHVYLGSHVSIIRSQVKNCIVYDNSTVYDSNITNSIIGSGSRVEGTINNIIVGPNSKIITEL